MGGGSKDSLGTGVGAAMPPSSQQVRHMKLRWQTGAASLGSGVLLIALSNSVLAAGLFQPAVNYGVGTNPAFVAAADFNGDGKPDLAVTNYGSNTVSILLGNGNGTFQAPVNYAVAGPPRFVALSDLNGDAKLDLASANQTSNNISILLGNGNGTFQVAVNYAVGVMPR